MDFELPDGDGPQATEQIKALMPAVKVIMLTARTDDQSPRPRDRGGVLRLRQEGPRPIDVLVDAIVGGARGRDDHAAARPASRSSASSARPIGGSAPT